MHDLNPSARAAPGVAAIAVLGGIVLLGNGLKAMISSSVLVSEPQFAAFLGIAVERVAVLLEAIVAGMVIALAGYPLLLRRFSARAIGIVACALAGAAFLAFALTERVHPDAATRELTVLVCFTLGAAALACLAPSAQALVALWPAADGRRTMTTLWTGAAPAGFLVAPQLVRVLVPVLGLSGYFLAFSVLPFAMLLLLVAIGYALRDAEDAVPQASPLPVTLLLAFLACVVAFEVWSTLGSVTGYLAPWTLASLVALAAAGAWLARSATAMSSLERDAPSSFWLLGALFVLEIPTTGFFEAAFLFQRGESAAFVADRSTLSAAAQIAGTVVAGALIHRRAAPEPVLLAAFAAVTVAGLASFAAYPWIAMPTYFLWTPAITGFGSGALTLVVCLAVMRDAQRVLLLAALPSIVIMVGTEFGLEALQIVFAAAQAAGASADAAFASVFGAQLLFGFAVAIPLVAARRRQSTLGTVVPSAR